MEYAKNTLTDIIIRLSLTNRSTHRKEIHALPTLWFRNTWSWKDGLHKPTLIKKIPPDVQSALVEATHEGLGKIAAISRCKDLAKLSCCAA